jgi:hypothetical protein
VRSEEISAWFVFVSDVKDDRGKRDVRESGTLSEICRIGFSIEMKHELGCQLGDHVDRFTPLFSEKNEREHTVYDQMW